MSPRSPESFQKIRDEQRENILRAAMLQFAEKGYLASSIREVAERANVSKGLLYNYFSSKKELLLTLFRTAIEQMDEVLTRAPNGGPRTKLIGMFEAFFEDLYRNPGFWRLFITLAMQDHGFDEIKQMMSEKIQGYYRILEKLFAELGYEDPEGEAKFVAALFDGVGVQYLALGESYPLQTLRHHIIKKYSDDAST